MSLLQADSLIAGYQEGIDILNEISISVQPESVTIIIGPNGAGKSTLLKAIYGFLKPRQGKIYFNGSEITHNSPHEIKQLGLSYIPQEFNVFPHMSVEENLLMGAWIFRKDRSRVRQQMDYVYGLFPALYTFRKSKANTLSGGQQRMLSIAKEIMTSPRLILVDEPSSGLSPKIAAEVYDLLMSTRQNLSAAILLVDHNMEAALELADYIYVVDMGKVRVHGPRQEFNLERIKTIIQECLMGV
jgi:ABC-type branched-subunit amino acid transport system ATPase component